jgi:ubiquinone/menaquinone biosynthesis C-methylase UbiE
MSAMEIFLEDYDRGKAQQRYRSAELPSLPFEKDEFDLALCSHFLFLYTDNLSLKFHIDAVIEMCRVAKEVRIFPILDANANRSAYVDHVKKGFDGGIGKIMEERVPYEFQKGGNIMLKITRDGVV